jgi:transposase
MTEYYPPETIVYRGCCHVIKIEAKFVLRHSGQRTRHWCQARCLGAAFLRVPCYYTREKEDRLCSSWSYTTFSHCARCLPLYPQDMVETCVSVVRFSRVGQAVKVFAGTLLGVDRIFPRKHKALQPFERSFGDIIVPERTETHFFSMHANAVKAALFARHWRDMARAYPAAQYLRVVVIDNASWHRGAWVTAVLGTSPHLALSPLPSASPKLQVIERFWKVRRRRATHYRLLPTMAQRKRTLRNNLCYYQTLKQRVLSVIQSSRKRTKSSAACIAAGDGLVISEGMAVAVTQ